MSSSEINVSRDTAMRVVREELARAATATKCHACGCLRDTVEALAKAAGGLEELAPALESARRVLAPKKYECLGCGVCYPAVAANAFAEAFPDAMPVAAFCPTDAPAERTGWPPLPGDYSVVRFGASVAVCTLNSEDLAKALAQAAPNGLAIVGTMRTENLGIERVIRNVLANPNIRFLVLCGEDTRQLIGHLPGQSMESVFANGLNEKQRIVGAKGKRPFLKNVSLGHIAAFKNQVQLVSMTGEQDINPIMRAIGECHAQELPPFKGAVGDVSVETIRAKEPQFYKSDPAGFFVVYPDHRTKDLVVEHYTNAGTLDCVVEGATPSAVYAEIVKRGLLSQLDHAAYLGRELATAERSLKTGEVYVQDRAPGDPLPKQEIETTNSCGPTCTSCH
jgi:tetrahydromethanopterin S-methyltransferase subunit A